MKSRRTLEGVAAFCRSLKPGLTLVDSNKNDMPKLEFAFEIAARMVARGSADRVSVLSWRSFLRLCGVWMTGDSLDTTYCWTFSRDALETINASGNPRRSFRGLVTRVEVSFSCGLQKLDFLRNPQCFDWLSSFRSGRHVVILDFKEGALSPAVMRELNKAAKSCGIVMFASTGFLEGETQVDYAKCSYFEIAMNIGVKHGVDFSDCAEGVFVLFGGRRWQQVHYDSFGCRCECLFLSAQEAHGFLDTCHSFNAAEMRVVFESEMRWIS